ncbi:hypothetical protein Vafri_16023, partial [Volvox africanus]
IAVAAAAAAAAAPTADAATPLPGECWHCRVVPLGTSQPSGPDAFAFIIVSPDGPKYPLKSTAAPDAADADADANTASSSVKAVPPASDVSSWQPSGPNPPSAATCVWSLLVFKVVSVRAPAAVMNSFGPVASSELRFLVAAVESSSTPTLTPTQMPNVPAAKPPPSPLLLPPRT